VEDVVNTGNSAIARGDALVKDLASGYRGWRVASAGEIPDGFAAHKIAINGTGKVLLADKNLIHASIVDLVAFNRRTMYKVGSNGKLVETNIPSESAMIAIDTQTLSRVK
jgi:hypothetical protein